MPGIFSRWQPAYDEAGIATFPVDAERKAPTVGNYLRAGRPASREWAAKFPEADALGFACGPRNRLTVVDVDAPNENLLADVLDRFGPSPIIIRTASGKYHVWYLHGGERRKIRAPGLDGPVDILGGGYAVAPPSRSAKGEYQFIAGSLADLGQLPTMAQACPANDPAEISPAKPGSRNESLFRACLRVAPDCLDFDMLLARAAVLNGGGLPPEEVARTAQSAWRYQCEHRNGLAGGRFVVIDLAAAQILRASPDASYLYQLLKAEHWGRDFFITNSWAKSLPLSLERLQNARRFLLRHNLIALVRRPKRGEAAVYRFASPGAVSQGDQGRGV